MNSRDLYNNLCKMSFKNLTAGINFSVCFSDPEEKGIFKELVDHGVIIKKQGECYSVGLKGIWLRYLYERTERLYVSRHLE